MKKTVSLRDFVPPPEAGHLLNLRADSRGDITISFHSLEGDRFSLGQGSFTGGFGLTQNKTIKVASLSVVYDCMHQLQMLSGVYQSVVPLRKVTHFTYQNLADRLGKGVDYDQQELSAKGSHFHTLQDSIAVVLYLLERLVDETKKYGTTTLVSEYVDSLVRMKQDEDNLMRKLKLKLNQVDRLRRAFIDEKEISVSSGRSLNAVIRNTIKTMSDEIETGAATMKYINKWQAARYDQNKLYLLQEEADQANTTARMHWNIALEERCHEEITAYIEEVQRDYMDEIQSWMEHYEGALEAKEMEIFNLRMEMEKLKDKYETIKSTYEERSVEMTNYLEYKKKKQEEEELLAYKTWAATKIQAWWRGEMFRHRLGPYKKKKGKGKGKAEKKKKAKKGK